MQANTIRVNLKDIEMGEVIDTGGSGAVISYWYASAPWTPSPTKMRLFVQPRGHSLASSYVDGWQCVCKEMNPEGTPPVAVEYFEKEITLLENLPHHRNIVRYLFHDMHHGKIRLFMTRYRSSLLFIVRTTVIYTDLRLSALRSLQAAGVHHSSKDPLLCA